jgi:two-component system, cell cycle sensor histidine kinase and response regulator CckA
LYYAYTNVKSLPNDSLDEIESLHKRVAELERANALLESGRYRELIEHARDMIWTVDEDATVTFLNSACQSTTGYTRQEMLQGDEIIAPEKLRVTHAALARKSDCDPSKQYEIQILAKDNRAVHLEVSSALLERAGAPDCILAIARDVTLRKETQESLRQNAENFEYLFSNHPMPMWVFDPHTLQFLEVNQAAVDKYGYSRQEFLAMSSADLRPPGEARRLRNFLRGLPAGDHGDAGHWRHLAKNGRIIDAEVFWRSVNFAGRDAVLSVIEDITERKLLEEQLRQSQKLEAVGRLAGGVAHEFNNLLTVILGYSQLLLNRTDCEHPMHAGLDKIRESAEKAGILTRQLVAFSRRQSLQPGILDLNKVVAGMEKMLRRIIGDRIELVTKLSPELGLVRADSSQIDQVVMNLVLNARDAMPQGGTVTLETADREVSELEAAAGHRPGPYAMVAVTDTGEGIDEESRRHLFEPFFSTRGEGEGAGLGLSVVYGMIQQHGGFIRVTSESGHGARFDVYLPRVPDLAGESIYESMETGGFETILVVDDEAGVLRLIAETLRGSGYTVIETLDSAEALEMATGQKLHVDLLLTDVMMPKVNGCNLADAWKILHPDLKVLFMSGDKKAPLADRKVFGLEERLLLKPFSGVALTRTVREVLDGRAS